MKKLFILIFTVITIPLLSASTSYNYSYYGDVLHSSPGYNYITHFNPQTLGVGYTNPQDFIVFEDKVYLLTRNETQTGDLVIVMDKNFNIINTYENFDLTDAYEARVQKEVDSVFEQIEEFFRYLLEDKVIYPGTTLPFNTISSIVSVATYSWESNDYDVVAPNGLTDNFFDSNQEAKLTLDIMIWGQSKTIDFDVEVGTFIDEIEAETTGFNYVIEDGFSTNQINQVLGTNFNSDEYETINDIISENRVEEENSFDYEDYTFTFSESNDEDKEFSNIKISLITDQSSDIHGSMFDLPYKTKAASGIEVVDSGIYIADTDNGRILKLNHDFEVIDAFYDVDYETFNTVDYKPLKVTVDSSGRMYVIANNIYEGILELDSDGSFNRFTGVNPITLSPIEILRRFLMTEAQRARLQKFLPTSYTNIAINDKSFIYATARPRETNTENMIQLINPKGVDVLKRNGYHIPMGDVMYVESINNYVIDGPSEFIDVAIGKNGIYSVLDTKRSRIFTYDNEGNLLYINGDDGDQSDKFTRGVAIDYLDDNIIVLDGSGTMIVYRPTEFGETVNKAVSFHQQGKFEEAAEQWEHALTLNTNYEVAYNGIGMYHLRQKNYKEAMRNFELGHDQYYYSKAFKSYRNELIKEHFGKAVLVIALVFVAYGSLKVYKKHRKENKL